MYKIMKLLEIHKNGINFHNIVVSYYGIDFDTKQVLFNGINTLSEAMNKAKELGYTQESEIQLLF